MSFQHIMGQDVAKKMLQSALRNHTVNHAYVFSGPPGSGQMNMAQIFAKALFCERQTDDARESSRFAYCRAGWSYD
jgi:DNA polymerase-3 subunit delta'